MNYSKNAKMIYNMHCATRLSSEQFKDYLKRLKKSIDSAKANQDWELEHDLVNLYNALATVAEGLLNTSGRLRK